MTYRDDREALQERVRELQEQVDGARREGQEEGREAAEARVQELERKLSGVRQEMDRLEAELASLRGGAPKKESPGRRPYAIVGVATLAAAGVAALHVLVDAARPEPPQVVVVSTPAPPPPDPPPNVEPPVPEPSKVEPPKAEPPPKPEARVAQARWRATVARAEGGPIGPGQPCFIDAAISTSETNAGVRSLTVKCGEKKIYDSADRMNGMAQMSSDPRERLGPTDDRGTFTLAYSDVGTRSGRAQIQIDTPTRQAEVWSDNLPRFRVVLRVPEASEPGEPLARAAQRLRRSAHVTEVSGIARVKVGASCLLRAMPTGRRSDCVAELACGTTILLPTSEESHCEYEGARPVKVTAEGGTVALTMTDDGLEVTAGNPAKLRAVLAFDPE